MLRRHICALVAAVSTVVAVGIASPASASNAGSFVALINADRARVGRAPLVHRADLAEIALRHSLTMAAQNNLHHNAALTGQVSNWRAVGENVGMGGSVRVLHQAFMNSPMHRANILDRDYTEIGLGVTVDARGVMWVTEVFRQPMRAAAQTTVSAVATPVARPAAATRRVVTTRRPAGTRSSQTKSPAVRWATRRSRTLHHPAGRSPWLLRLARAAGSHAAPAAGALPQAVDYLHVVTG